MTKSNAFRSLLSIRFVAVAFQLWRSPLEKGPSFTYYGPALDSSHGGFGPKVDTNVRGSLVLYPYQVW